MTSNTPAPSSLPPREKFFAPDSDDDQSSHRHRLLIGCFGLSMPALLYGLAGWRPTEGLERWEPLDSVSAYYYTGGAAAFVGILVALGVFLVTYGGYKNEYQLRDRIAAIVAGLAAFGVALFPTKAPHCELIPSWWTSVTGTIHLACAIVLFGSFVFFCLHMFLQTAEQESLSKDKRRRNRLYRFCGWAMVVCILLIIALERTDNPFFWPEAIAVELFAVSWLVKGRVDHTFRVTLNWAWYYLRHPGELAHIAKNVRSGKQRKAQAAVQHPAPGKHSIK